MGDFLKEVPQTPKNFTRRQSCLMEAKLIGAMVTGIVDRPMGSAHPDHPDMIYPINYGYVEGLIAGDGEEQDVYILGADRPLSTFSGRLIAIWRRKNDAEDKWIVSVDEREYSDAEITVAIRFQEQYFDGELIRPGKADGTSI